MRSWLLVTLTVALLMAGGCVELFDDDDDVADDDAADDDVADDDIGDDDTVPDDSLLTCSEVGGDEVCLDAASDLTWQRDSGATARSWQDSVDHCEGLAFAGVDDWRIATISELRTIVRACGGTESWGSCEVTDECAELSCWDDGCEPCMSGFCHWDSALGGPCDASHWSGTTVTDSEATAWFVGFYSGGLINDPKDNESYVRCVRDGPVG